MSRDLWELTDEEKLYALRTLASVGVPVQPASIGIAKRALDVLADEGLVDRNRDHGLYCASTQGIYWMDKHGGPFPRLGDYDG